jgi:hypothetical protein
MPDCLLNPLNTCNGTQGVNTKCISGVLDYAKQFGSDFVLTGLFGSAPTTNASCEGDINWITIFKTNECTPQAYTTGFSGSQITSCDQGVVYSRTFSSSDRSGTPTTVTKNNQLTCLVNENKYSTMSECRKHSCNELDRYCKKNRLWKH